MAEQETATRTRNTTTEYIVLAYNGEQETWSQASRADVIARSRKDAVAQATADFADKSGTFVAIPRREWKPMSRKVETKQVETWE